MVGFGSLWTFSSGLYCFFFTLHFSVPEISLYIKSACLLPPTYKFCTYYGTKVFFPPAVFRYFYTYMQFCNVFRRFLAVISFTKLCNSAVWNDFPQYGKRNALQVPASGTKIVLNALSYFLSTPAMVSHIKKCYTNYDIIVHRAARLPHGITNSSAHGTAEEKEIILWQKCDRRSIRRPHLSHQFQPGRRL